MIDCRGNYYVRVPIPDLGKVIQHLAENGILADMYPGGILPEIQMVPEKAGVLGQPWDERMRVARRVSALYGVYQDLGGLLGQYTYLRATLSAEDTAKPQWKEIEYGFLRVADNIKQSLMELLEEPTIREHTYSQWSSGQNLIGTTHGLRILFLAANPVDGYPLRLKEEVRQVRTLLQRATQRDRLEILPLEHARAEDLLEALLMAKPDILHFAGHGDAGGVLYLEGEDDKRHPVAPQAIEQLLRALDKPLQCVVLNACYSGEQAQAFSKYVPCVIGVDGDILDVAALEFPKGFYLALGEGHSFDKAYEAGKAAVDLKYPGEARRLVLIRTEQSATS